MENKLKYPVIFVHGLFGWGDDEGLNAKLPYWGATTGNLIDYMNSLGYETHSASVGPVSSAWDRACELYARLMGTRVDYGKAHSHKFGHHRFGRTYKEPLIENWDDEHKIHIIGHSFGGTTVRLLAHLLTNGDPDEIEKTDPDDISPLFTGGKEGLIKSLVCICAPNNGTTQYSVIMDYKMLPFLKFVVYNYIAVAGRSHAQGKTVDFHLEQFSFSNTPGLKDVTKIRSGKKYVSSSDDSVIYDMSTKGAKEMNERIKISPDIYYFSYSYNCVMPAVLGRFNLPTKADFSFLKFTSCLLLAHNVINDKCGNKQYNHYANDGLVNITSARYPDTDNWKYYNPDSIEKGLWNVMPTRHGDHGTPIGLFADKEETHKLYRDMFEIFEKCESV